ncbi:hypothetical protein AVEN_9932-1 [Araneus ventricosus]|uniref:Uncharacterized protein n=1 Tax=Araneus ventricosus TaxID=182803 RepID=A0A4Y2NAW3_ARAVE|nr:hypothetical protein AVEN_9932-1 [Araneus ventricosus]
MTLETCTGEKAKKQRKLDSSIEWGSRKFLRRVYLADINDSCIQSLDFLQKYECTVDLENNKTRTGGEQIPLLSSSIQHRKGTSHKTADAVSQRSSIEISKHCSNVEKFGLKQIFP